MTNIPHVFQNSPNDEENASHTKRIFQSKRPYCHGPHQNRGIHSHHFDIKTSGGRYPPDAIIIKSRKNPEMPWFRISEARRGPGIWGRFPASFPCGNRAPHSQSVEPAGGYGSPESKYSRFPGHNPRSDSPTKWWFPYPSPR